ncbi:MAG: transcriptional repressor [Sphaerochaetaceae bacterium]|nr:transcriptional repressor [Sphaerochaetaceae bacterium]
MTSYSKEILDIINSSHDHLTAEQVFLKMKDTEPRIVLASVYNNLNRLCSEGLVRRLSVEGCPDRFDRTSRHDHLICSKCGKVSDIGLDDMTGAIERQLGVKILNYDLRVGYLCPECRVSDKCLNKGEC